MANYKKRRTAKNSRARRHSGGWTLRGKLRYERHFSAIVKEELGSMAEVNKSFQVAQMLCEALKSTSDTYIRDVRTDELACGCCMSLCFSILIDGEWREYYIEDDDIYALRDQQQTVITVDLRGKFPPTAGIEILRVEMANIPDPMFALIRYSLDGEFQDEGIRMDLGKQVFLDHFDEGEREKFMLSIALPIWDIATRAK